MEASRLDYGRMNQPSPLGWAGGPLPYHLLHSESEV